MAEKTYSKEDVLKVWNEKAGRENYFELRETESTEGVKVTQLISGGGSLTAQVNAQGADAYKQLVENAGNPLIDDGVNPKESAGDKNKKFYTKDGNVAFPTQPEAISGPGETVEIDNTGGKTGTKAKSTGNKTTDINSRNVAPSSSTNTSGTRTVTPTPSGNSNERTGNNA